MLGLPSPGYVRTTRDAASGVLAQFGGVMLAFVIIATIGTQGVVTQLLQDVLGWELFAQGAWIYALPGVAVAYIIFQVPLMTITFMPALSALKPQWIEAHFPLAGPRPSSWLPVGFPGLAHPLLARLLRMLSTALSSYATPTAPLTQSPT